MLRTYLGIGVSVLTGMMVCGPAKAQYAPVDPAPLGQAATSVMANKISGDIAGGRVSSRAISSRCFADSGPGPDRRALEAGYASRLKSSGRAVADAWRAEQGRVYRAKLVASGKCRAD